MDKASLRKEYREVRSALSAFEVELYNQQLVKHLLDIDYSGVKYLHIFLPILKHNEPDMWRYLSQLSKRYPAVNVVVSKSNLSDYTMEHFLYSSELRLVENKWGITEPTSGERVDERRIDLVLVPLLVADTRGNRVGYGKGFYDRFLAKCRKDCLKIGVSFFEPVKEISDVDRYDVLLDKLVTPLSIYSFD